MSWLHSSRAQGGESRRTTQSTPISDAPRETSTISTATIQTTLQRAQVQWRRLMQRPEVTLMESHPTPTETTLSINNSRVNNPWGDVRGKKGDNITRIYAINLNGLQLDDKGGKFDSVCRSVKEIQADVFCGQEHNVDTTQAKLRHILFDTASQHWERNRLVIGTSPIPFSTPFKPGGTLVMTVGSLTGRLFKQERDKWGRWSSQVYQGQAGRKIAVISAYQPIVKGGTAGKITVAAQQVSLLLQSADKVTNPRVAFRRDLSTWLKDYQTAGYEILLVGDFNEPLGIEARRHEQNRGRLQFDGCNGEPTLFGTPGYLRKRVKKIGLCAG
jgi:hypothetical protein